jgi:hypothetical protein
MGFYELKGSKYKYVRLVRNGTGDEMYRAVGVFVNGVRLGSKSFRVEKGNYDEAERKAALFVDKQLIENGCRPVNILKKRSE